MAASEALVERLKRLHVDRSHGDSAPHKPLLLLAVLDLVESGVIDHNRISHDPGLIERFNDYWVALAPSGFQARSWLPFFHLRYDGFWKLSPQPNTAQRLATMQSPKSNRQLRETVSHAALTDEAWRAVQSDEVRLAMRSTLLTNYFGEADRAKLQEVMQEGREVSSYVDELLDRAHQEPFRIQHEKPPTVTATRFIRDKGFRRLIRQLYDETCSLCELRLVTEEGRSALEAAHIIPYAECFNDDPRNGLGLCPVHHWCYDEGLIGLSSDYVVVVSESLVETRPTEDRLINLRGRLARLPSEESLRPAPEALEQHCRTHLISA